MTDAAPSAGATSPFKFLDAYGAQDAPVFFGRDEEIETLYRLLGESRLVLVYGQSGTGKTSLVQSGLTKKFSPTNWLPLTVRRGDDLGASLEQALNAAAITPIAPGTPMAEMIRSVFLDHLRPVFLIFDQFEELYVLGSKAEQDAFYAAIKAVLEANLSCRVIVLLREEYLAALDPFERAVPALFDKRLRVEVMTNANVEKVIVGTCAAHGIVLEHGLDTAKLIIAQLDDKRIGVQLAYLQVYLDHLYRTAAVGSGPVIFTDAAIAEAGKLGDIMAGFLDEQEKAIAAQLGGKVQPGVIARLLEQFVSVKGTKQPSTYAEVLKKIPNAEPWLQSALDLMQNSRLLRRVDDHYELAHDALATRIDERRSAESKRLLMVEQLVGNRVAEFGQTGTLLNPEELALVRQARRIRDPLDGSMMLKLDAAAVDFEQRSRRRMWLRRFAWAGGLALALIIPLALVLHNRDQARTSAEQARTAELQQAQAQVDKANASNAADVIAFGVYARARPADRIDPLGIARWAHESVRVSNTNRDFAPRDVPDGMAEKSFWWRLYGADETYGTISPDQGLAQFRLLEQEQRAARAAHPQDVVTLVKLKAALWHHYFWRPWPDPVIGRELFELLEGEVKGAGKDPLDFKADLIDVCTQATTPKVLIERCKPYRTQEDGSAVEAPASESPDAALAPPRIDYGSMRQPGN